MAVSFRIEGGGGNGGRIATVTERGELVTAAYDYSVSYTATMSSANTAYNLITPKSGMRFVVTGYVVTARSGVSNVTDANIIIYEATSSSTTTVSKTIASTGVVRFGREVVTGVRLISSVGVWINAKADDATCFVNLFGYYVTA